mmetsp:Transcript_71314/g.133392  ORF Transcript_71314/g.133392 Transcript_71314/m.133392 type:complete len:352 (+) Transcript_71314:64-1119(+)
MPVSKKEAAKKNGAAGSGAGKQAAAAVKVFSDKYVPDNLKPHVEKAAEFVGVAVDFLVVKGIPTMSLCYDKGVELHTKLQPYHIDDLGPAILGLIICFFGGTYLTLIAAIEAYNMMGWTPTRKALGTLWTNGQLALDACKKDDDVDANGDGKSDAKQLLDNGEYDELLKRKTLIVLKTVNPEEVTDAVSAISGGLFAVVATLKVQFAKAITLGASIGEMITPPAIRYLQPVLETLIPEEYKKWTTPILKYLCKSMAISVAWFLQRIISACHSSIRGGLMFARGLLAYLGKANIIDLDHHKTYLDEAVGFGVAFVGFTVQLRYGFALPFPLNLLFFPITICEYLLMWMVNAR